MRIGLAVAFITALCGACELPGARAIEPQEPPLVLSVKQPPPPVAAMSVLTEPLVKAPELAPDGSEGRPFPTLALALAAAPAGALLRVSESAWRERVVILKPVVLMGRGPTRTLLIAPDGTGTEIEVRADHVEIHGLSVEGGQIGIRFTGGAGHRLEDVVLTGSSESGLSGKNAGILFVSSAVTMIGNGTAGRGVDLDGGSVKARQLMLRRAGRRGIVLHGTRAVLEDLDARDAALSALQ